MDLQKLSAYGVDCEDGLKRFSMNQKIYEKHLRKFVDLTLLDEIEDALNRCEIGEAFEACHKLKAYVGNLSMPALFDEVCDLTEWLREGRTSVLNEKFRRVKGEYQKVAKGLEEVIADERVSADRR